MTISMALLETSARKNVLPIFKLSDLVHVYKVRLEQLGAGIDGHIYTARIQMRLLSVFPDL